VSIDSIRRSDPHDCLPCRTYNRPHHDSGRVHKVRPFSLAFTNAQQPHSRIEQIALDTLVWIKRYTPLCWRFERLLELFSERRHASESVELYRFGTFELDPQSTELRQQGLKIKLQKKSCQMLLILLDRAGSVVPREVLRAGLWPADTFVDFDANIKTVLNKLRQSLGDLAENPIFIETIPKIGFRFIAPVTRIERGESKPVENPLPHPQMDQIVQETLEKDRTLRYQSAAEIRTDLQRLKRDTESGSLGAAVQPSQTSGSAIAGAKQHKGAVAAGLFAVLILLGTAGFGVYSLLHRPAPTPFQKFTVTQVTNSGKAARAAISPDGRYVLSVMDDNGIESLWLRNVPTGSDTQVLPPSASHYESLAFSPDGNYIYFRKAQSARADYFYNLYRSPILGGTPQTVVQNIDSEITFSPDGQHIAYVRKNDPKVGKYRLLSASLEGNGERVLQIGSESEAPYSLSWSTGGDEIFYCYVAVQGLGAIDILDIHTGKSHRFTTFNGKFPTGIHLSPDGRTLFTNYRQTGANWAKGQIGFLRGTGGDIEPITRDTNKYTTLTLSADGKTLATVLARSYATISVLSKAVREFGEPRTLLSQSNEYNQSSGLSWSADGNLLLGNSGHLLKLGADGKNQTQLLADSNAVVFQPSSCGTNYLVLAWRFHGGTNSSLWRTNADGTNPLRLSDGKQYWSPVCSPDEKWVYYEDLNGHHICRVSLDGSGKTEAIFGGPQGYLLDNELSLSPDGKTLATAVGDLQRPVVEIALFDLGSSSAPRMLGASHYSGGVQFAPDGKSIAYATRENGVDNVWVQPLDGSAGHRITDFKSDKIWSFHLSPDGKSLGVLRGHFDSDVVLLQESKP
jgi:Tol biopolymer transport system component/DNA-binding winged helix-turn-helix (wHTH) protein